MPACKVGCCPDDVCDCSNDCECLLPSDAELSPGVGFENPFLIAEHDLKGVPDDTRLKICPCRTKEELTDYVKPIEAHLHGGKTVDRGKDDDLNSPKKQDASKNTNPDKCSETSVEKESSKSGHTGTHASHGHKDKCCDDVTCAKTAEKDRGSTHGKTNASCCADESCQKKCDSPPENGNHHHHKAAKTCCEDKSCQGGGEPKDRHRPGKCGTDSCCDGKASEQTHKHSKSANGSCCGDKNCEKTKPSHEKHQDSCCSDESCEANKLNKEDHKNSCCESNTCGESIPSGETHKHSHTTTPCCEDKSCDANNSSKKDHSASSGDSCCENKTCGESTPSEKTHQHSHTPAPCCGDKSCGGKSPAKETHKHPQCCDDKGCSKSLERASKSFHSGVTTLPRTNSLPTNSATANPNSPTRIAKVPNFEIKSNFSFDANLSPMPYRKTRRSQSLAEARLGSLLSERRPSCFQLSTQELRDGVLPDPHRGHDHHHAHEYHHSLGCRHHHHGSHDHHHGNHDHHHGNHDHDHHDHHDNHDDDSHHHGNDSCCQGNDSTDRNSCCEDPTCGGESPSSIEELKPLMKSEGSKVDVGEMVVRTTKLRVQNMCCPKEAQIVHDELRKLEVCLLNFIFSLAFAMSRGRSVKCGREGAAFIYSYSRTVQAIDFKRNYLNRTSLSNCRSAVVHVCQILRFLWVWFWRVYATVLGNVPKIFFQLLCLHQPLFLFDILSFLLNIPSCAQ